jgi:hypothetical protein
MLSQKQIRERTGIPRSTLAWLLNRLEIMPVETRRTLFGREFFMYDDSCIDSINDWLNSQLERKLIQQDHSGKKRCMGGCRKWYAKSEMFSVYCKPCYVKKSIMTLISHGCKFGQTDPLLIKLTKEFVSKL